MGNGQGGPRNKLLQMVRDCMDVLDAMVDEEDLASSFELPVDGILDDFIIVTDNEGPDRQAILGRGLDEAEIPNSRDSHLEGPRIGVAVSVITSTSFLICFSFSL